MKFHYTSLVGTLLLFLLLLSCKKDNVNYKENLIYENTLSVLDGYMYGGAFVTKPIANADVRLYNNFNDYVIKANEAFMLKSDSQGICKLQGGILPKYWLTAKKEAYSNIINNQIRIDSIESYNGRIIFNNDNKVTTTHVIYNVYLFPKMIKVNFNIKVAGKTPKFAALDLSLSEADLKNRIKITSSKLKYYLPRLFRDFESTRNGSLFFKELEVRKYWYSLLADGKIYSGEFDLSNEIGTETTLDLYID